MRTKNVSKRLMLTKEKAGRLNDFLKDNNITFQDLVEPFIDSILEDDSIPEKLIEKNFYEDMCKK